MPTGQPTLITYRDTTRTIRGWSLALGIPYKTLWARLHSGWPLEEALYMPRWQRRAKHQPLLPGLAPHIRGPAIASGGVWIPLSPWQATD